MFTAVMDTPKAAIFEAIVFEYIVKHWPFAHKVVVVCVIALKIVDSPAEEKILPAAPSS